MKTIVNYTLYFSRENAHPFLAITTHINDKAGKTIHSHHATISGDYEWELREMWEQWTKFKTESADVETSYCGSFSFGKFISITKMWEG